MYEPWVDFFTHEVMKMPVFDRPEHKRSFLPSKSEKVSLEFLFYSHFSKLLNLQRTSSETASDIPKFEQLRQSFLNYS